MAFEKYATERLKKYQKILLVSSIVALGVMCFVLGIALYQISHDNESQLIYLVPTVFGPLCFIPIIFSGAIGTELKKRKSTSD